MSAEDYLAKRRVAPVYRITESGHLEEAPLPTEADAAYLDALSRTNTVKDYPKRDERFVK